MEPEDGAFVSVLKLNGVLGLVAQSAEWSASACIVVLQFVMMIPGLPRSTVMRTSRGRLLGYV